MEGGGKSSGEAGNLGNSRVIPLCSAKFLKQRSARAARTQPLLERLLLQNGSWRCLVQQRGQVWSLALHLRHWKMNLKAGNRWSTVLIFWTSQLHNFLLQDLHLQACISVGSKQCRGDGEVHKVYKIFECWGIACGCCVQPGETGRVTTARR